MRRRTNDFCRVTSSLGLLLLLAAHEKVCPWLTHEPADATAEQAAAAPPAADPESSPVDSAPRRSKAPLSIGAVLPGDMLARLSHVSAGPAFRPAAWEPRAAFVSGAARPGQHEAGAAAVVPPAYLELLSGLARLDALSVLGPQTASAPRDPALGTSISPHGPPTV